MNDTLTKLRAALAALESAEPILSRSYRDSHAAIAYKCHTSAADLRSVIEEMEKAEPNAYQYLFEGPYGPVWRNDGAQWNGLQPIGSRPLFAHPQQPKSEPVQEPVAWVFRPHRELLWPDEVEAKNPLELDSFRPLYAQPKAEPQPNYRAMIAEMDMNDRVLAGIDADEKTRSEPEAEPSSTEKELRRMLCVAYAGPSAYMDDGEAQDSRDLPCIDFLRDSPAEIQDKMRRRGLKQLAAQPKAEPVQEPVAIVGRRLAWDASYCLEYGAKVKPGDVLYAAAPQATDKESLTVETVQEPTESVLIDGIAYTIPSAVACELLRLHIELQSSAKPVQEPFAWRCKGDGLKRHLTQRQYEANTPATQAWYEPYKCASCAAAPQAKPPSERVNQDLLNALHLVMQCAGDIKDVPNSLLEMALDDGDEETRAQANAFLVARAAITAAVIEAAHGIKEGGEA